MISIFSYLFLFLSLAVAVSHGAYFSHHASARRAPASHRLALVEEWCGRDNFDLLRRQPRSFPDGLATGDERTISYAQDFRGKDCRWMIRRVEDDLYLNMMQVNKKTADWWYTFAHRTWADLIQSGSPTQKQISIVDALSKFKEKFVTRSAFLSPEKFCERYRGSVFGQPEEENVEGWVVFATSHEPFSLDFRSAHIEMFMSVSTTPQFPGSVHIGISRNPEYGVGFKGHKNLSLKLHEYAYRTLKNLHGCADAASIARYIFALPLPVMSKIMLRSLPAGTVSIGTKETLGNMGGVLSEEDCQDPAKLNLFERNRRFLSHHPYKAVFMPPVLSVSEDSVKIGDAEHPDRDSFVVGKGMRNMMELHHSEQEDFERAQNADKPKPPALTVYADKAFPALLSM